MKEVAQELPFLPWLMRQAHTHTRPDLQKKPRRSPPLLPLFVDNERSAAAAAAILGACVSEDDAAASLREERKRFAQAVSVCLRGVYVCVGVGENFERACV